MCLPLLAIDFLSVDTDKRGYLDLNRSQEVNN